MSSTPTRRPPRCRLLRELLGAPGMQPGELLFLFGLGIVYASIFRLTRNIFIIWPLVTPLGGFYNRLESGEMEGLLPSLSVLGFAELIAAMLAVLVLGAWWHRRRRRTMARGVGEAVTAAS